MTTISQEGPIPLPGILDAIKNTFPSCAFALVERPDRKRSTTVNLKGIDQEYPDVELQVGLADLEQDGGMSEASFNDSVVDVIFKHDGKAWAIFSQSLEKELQSYIHGAA